MYLFAHAVIIASDSVAPCDRSQVIAFIDPDKAHSRDKMRSPVFKSDRSVGKIGNDPPTVESKNRYAPLGAVVLYSRSPAFGECTVFVSKDRVYETVLCPNKRAEAVMGNTVSLKPHIDIELLSTTLIPSSKHRS